MRTDIRITVPTAEAEAPAIDDQTRALIRDIADTLMPDRGLMPSVVQADTAGHFLDVALIARPDLVDRFLGAVARCTATTVADDLSALRQEDGKDWEVLTTILPAAYLMNPEVRESLGYRGQTPQPIITGTSPEEVALTDAVLARGNIYRPTPSP